MIKKYSKKTWEKLSSPEAKKKYTSAGRTFSKVGKGAAQYFEGANRGIDQVIGTRDPSPGKLTGVAIPKGYKVKIVPKIIRGPRGYSVFEEKQLVRIQSPKKRKTRSKIKRRKR